MGSEQIDDAEDLTGEVLLSRQDTQDFESLVLDSLFPHVDQVLEDLLGPAAISDLPVVQIAPDGGDVPHLGLSAQKLFHLGDAEFLLGQDQSLIELGLPLEAVHPDFQ